MKPLRVTLLTGAVLISAAGHAQTPRQPSALPAPSAATLQAQINTMADIIQNLRGEIDRSISETKRSFASDLANRIDEVKKDQNEKFGDVKKDEEAFNEFKKGEGDRVGQMTQQTLGWFNTIMGVGGGISAVVGCLVTLLVVWFSIQTSHNAKVIARDITEQHLKEYQKHLDILDEEIRRRVEAVNRGVETVNSARNTVSEDLKYTRQARKEAEAFSQKLRTSPADLFGELFGTEGQIGNRQAAGTKSAMDAYTDLVNLAKKELTANRYMEAFQHLEQAEDIAPTEELRLVVVDAQAEVLRARGANEDAIALLREKLEPFTGSDVDQSLPTELKFQAARMLIRLGLLFKESSLAQALDAYDDASNLVMQSTDIAGSEIYASAQINKAGRLRQVRRYADAITCYRNVAARVSNSRSGPLHLLAAEMLFNEGKTFQEETDGMYGHGQESEQRQGRQKGYHSAIACFEKLDAFAKDRDLHLRLLCADGLLQAGILHGLLIGQAPDQRNLAIAGLGRVEELFGDAAESEMKERVERARFLRARLLKEDDTYATV